jgi:steroid 5-alpha reductase family enzyme
MTHQSKTNSLIWILIAYLCCIAAAGAYLFFNHDNMLVDSFIADVIATVVIFAFSRAFKNSSFYDAYWSVIPPLFLLYWWFTRETDTQTLRYVLVSIVVWYWACRLTFNWAKHWEGLGHEDWRYPIVKQKFPKVEIFSDFFGIHFFPTIQVFLGMLPMYAAVALSNKAVGWLDYVAFAVGVTAVSIQLIADRQLHQFIATRKPGQIIDTGLWSWSRHPNYFGEICFWLSLALFGLSAYPEGWWWQIIGFTSMLIMFLTASIPLMETRSLERRPQYQDIINRVSMLVPLPPKKK